MIYVVLEKEFNHIGKEETEFYVDGRLKISFIVTDPCVYTRMFD